jgi:hypothetical protein
LFKFLINCSHHLHLLQLAKRGAHYSHSLSPRRI